jgi:transposase
LLQVKREQLLELEKLAQSDQIDLFYADEAAFSSEGNVPYGWQFKDERVSLPTQKGKSVHCLALLSRQCKCHFELSDCWINAAFVERTFDDFSLKITKLTVIVLDNAAIHKSQKIKERLSIWQQRGLYIFFLPPYSPQLNIIEILWRELKYRWLSPNDYREWEALRLSLRLALAAVGSELFIRFDQFEF